MSNHHNNNKSNKNNNNSDPLANWHSAISEIDDPKVLEAYQDAMEDVHTRFLLNLPPEELATADRILFQIEQAWWFYEDWICDQQQLQQQQDATSTTTATTTFQLPRFKHLKPFAVEMFQFSPLLDTKKFFSMWETFSKYKRKISTYGCILLNKECNKIVLCQDYNSKSWTFPAGKINQGEEGMDAAARETWEETGFDPNGKYGLTQQMITTAAWKHPLQEKDAVAYTEDNGKRRTYYICYGVPEDFPFEPVARKEVSMVQWHPLSNVPKKNFAVLPILPKIRRWIKRNISIPQQQQQQQHHKTPKKQRDRSKGRHGSPTKNQNNSKAGGVASGGGMMLMNSDGTLVPVPSAVPTNAGSNNNNNRNTPNRDRKKQGSRPKSRGKVVQADDPLLETGLASVGSQNRWTEEDMFAANEKILGRKVEYDGNPHVFSEQGFQGMDPHHFHIVGGNFLNSETNALAPPPPTSRLQHLFHTKSAGGGGGVAANASSENPSHLQQLGGGAGPMTDDSGEVLTPFFSDDGATPWGEVVEEVKESVASPERYMMLTKDKTTTTSCTKNKKQGKINNSKKGGGGRGKQPTAIMATSDNDADLVFLTDQEITERSQKIKLAEWRATNSEKTAVTDRKYQQDMRDIKDWVDSLPQPRPTKLFDAFVFDVDALMEAYYQHY